MTFSFCEGVSASGSSPWHVRPLEISPVLKLTGGIDTDSLCGTVKAPYGWDLQVPFTAANTSMCRLCRERYEEYLRYGSLYVEHAGKKFARMRHVDGLTKQLVDKVARIEWYVLHEPTPQLAFYLLEFSMRRRLHVKSSHWFAPEHFLVCVPPTLPVDFMKALESLPSLASPGIGVSSGARPKPLARKATRATPR